MMGVPDEWVSVMGWMSLIAMGVPDGWVMGVPDGWVSLWVSLMGVPDGWVSLIDVPDRWDVEFEIGMNVEKPPQIPCMPIHNSL